MRSVAATLLLVSLGVVACSSGDDVGPSAVASTTTASAADASEPQPVLAVPAVPAVGEAVVALGDVLDVTLEVERCEFDDAPLQGPEPVVRVDLVATGTDGTDRVLVQLNRFVAAGAAETITDTITVRVGPESAPRLLLQAQRFEVDGQISDGRDPDADDPLVRIFGGRVQARGVFAPPGNFAADGGLVEGVVLATCAEEVEAG